MTKDDKSPEFTPSILHNRRGPLHAQRTRVLTILPRSFAEFLLDRRVQALLCVFLPPGAVFLQAGFSRKFALSILLSFLFIFPGILFAFYVTFLEKAVNPDDGYTFNV